MYYSTVSFGKGFMQWLIQIIISKLVLYNMDVGYLCLTQGEYVLLLNSFICLEGSLKMFDHKPVSKFV